MVLWLASSAESLRLIDRLSLRLATESLVSSITLQRFEPSNDLRSGADLDSTPTAAAVAAAGASGILAGPPNTSLKKKGA
jgi:hypothetical protein